MYRIIEHIVEAITWAVIGALVTMGGFIVFAILGALVQMALGY